MRTIAEGVPRAGVVSAAFVMAVPLLSVPGKSLAAIARKAGAPAVVVANRAWVAVVDVDATTIVPLVVGPVRVTVPEFAPG